MSSKQNKITKHVNKNIDVSQYDQVINMVERVLLMCRRKQVPTNFWRVWQ